MESSVILSNYLTSNSELDSIISYTQFESLFPINVSRSTLKDVYDDLCSQREEMIRERVLQDINNLFAIPMNSLTKILEQTSSKGTSIDQLNIRLKKLIYMLGTKASFMRKDIGLTLEKLEDLALQLNKFNESHDSIYNTNLVLQVYESIQKIESRLRPS